MCRNRRSVVWDGLAGGGEEGWSAFKAAAELAIRQANISAILIRRLKSWTLNGQTGDQNFRREKRNASGIEAPRRSFEEVRSMRLVRVKWGKFKLELPAEIFILLAVKAFLL